MCLGATSSTIIWTPGGKSSPSKEQRDEVRTQGKPSIVLSTVISQSGAVNGGPSHLLK